MYYFSLFNFYFYYFYSLILQILQELRARTVAATVQKLRKTAGLVVADKVEIFYEETPGAGNNSVAAALLKNTASTVARIKSLPLPMELCPKASQVIIKEVVNDPDISKNPVTLVLTYPCVSVDLGAVGVLLSTTPPPPPSTVASTNTPPVTVDLSAMAAMYLQTMAYDQVVGLDSVMVTFDKVKLVLRKGEVR